MSLLFYLMIAFFILLALLLCLFILVQETKSFGLGASFGGDAGNSLFGTSTAFVLKKITAYLAGFFLIASFSLSLWTNAIGRKQSTIFDSSLQKEQLNKTDDESVSSDIEVQ